MVLLVSWLSGCGSNRAFSTVKLRSKLLIGNSRRRFSGYLSVWIVANFVINDRRCWALSVRDDGCLEGVFSVPVVVVVVVDVGSKWG